MLLKFKTSMQKIINSLDTKKYFIFSHLSKPILNILTDANQAVLGSLLNQFYPNILKAGLSILKSRKIFIEL